MLSGKSISLRPVMEKDLDFLYAKHTEISNRGDYFPLGVQSEPAFRKHFQEEGFWSNKAGMLVMENHEGEIVGSIEFFYSSIRTIPGLEESPRSAAFPLRVWRAEPGSTVDRIMT